MFKRKYYQNTFLVIRLILGLVFLLSGIGKLINSSDAQYLVELLATKFYWLIEYTAPIVTAVSILEIILALALLWNKMIKSALAGALVMIISFSSVLYYFYRQGANVESCGCFGAFGFESGLEFTLFRNLILILLIVTALIIKGITKAPKKQEATSSV